MITTVDKNKDGKIRKGFIQFPPQLKLLVLRIPHKSLQAAMRRAGHNPTDVEVTDIINKIDSDSGNIDFQVRLLCSIF